MPNSSQHDSFHKRWELFSGAPAYLFALLITWLTLSVWALWPIMREAPASLFVAAVAAVARFAGFGPALLCSFASAFCLDYFIFSPQFTFATRPVDLERLTVFVGICIIVASMARQRSKAERRAAETRQQMAAIVESSDDAIFSTRPDGTITSWNRGAEMLYQYAVEEAMGRHVSLICPSDRLAEVQQNTDRINRGESVASYQTERQRKDGSKVSVMISISPLRTPTGEIVGASAIARDISAQKRSEEALRRNEKLATAGRLAASIAHEINNPLEAVTNLIYLARHDSLNANDYLQMAESEVARVGRIAQQALGFVRDPAVAAHLDVGAVLEEVLQLYASKLKKKQVRVEKRFHKVEIQAYSGELRQLFSNLIVNALDALQPGGCLYLRVGRGTDRSTPGRSGVRVVVADNGTGIAPEHFEHLFEPFYTTKKDSGTGLGLWLSLGIVRKHGGSIRVRSRTQGAAAGTVFSIFLPELVQNSKAA
ncbi:MAG TPA: PAS domain S-box protein [Terriglobales bacterium]|jgi:PAS domain S-box-containing protein|nr:PAS domain S-box protein [Terriglobales bacterium]